jgi:nitrate reductase molybdenum cofactor assembly chaperone NarJ/NarW
MSIHESYLGLAQLLNYPDDKEGLLETYYNVASYLAESGLTTAAPFGAFLRSSSLAELQEDYVASFDFNPKASPYLGHHLYGDNQKKAAYMIRVKQEFSRHDFVPAGGELPDHVAVLLGFLAHLAQRGDDGYRRQFIAELVLPGLDKMAAAKPARRQPAWQSLVDTAEQLCSADCKEVLTC